MLNKVAKRVAQRKGIACFLSNCDNLLMWAHYADSHKGVCLKFNILEDTIYVVSALSGGPSEALGIRSGDRIISVEKNNVAGIKITNNDVIKKLRGIGGTKVNVGILRRGSKNILKYSRFLFVLDIM